MNIGDINGVYGVMGPTIHSSGICIELMLQIVNDPQQGQYFVQNLENMLLI